MNRIVEIQRNTTGDSGTFGQLTVLDISWSCFTGELPWRNNMPNISCFCAGEYYCTWTRSNRFSQLYGRDFFTYQLNNVDGHEGIRIHSANFMGDVAKGFKCELKGCVALGYEVGRLSGQDAIIHSRDAITEFQNIMNYEDFILRVYDIPGEEFI